MSNDERLEKFDSHVEELRRAIQLCLDQDCVIPAMMLLFAATDGMSWLYRTNDDYRVGPAFREWVDSFWIDQTGGISSDDLWAARNALLHEQTSNSNDTRSGKATPLFYVSRHGRMDIPFDGKWDKRPPVGVRAEELLDAFITAIGRFRAHILESEPKRNNQILSRCGEWFDKVRPQGYFRGE